MNNPIDPNEAAAVLGELLRTNPKRATGLAKAIFGEPCVPQATKELLANILVDFNNVIDEGGATLPFAKRNTIEDVHKHYGLDPKSSNECFDHVRNDDIAQKVIQKMGGSDAERRLSEVTIRDQVEAAVNAHHEGDPNV